jgi:TolB-like protein
MAAVGFTPRIAFSAGAPPDGDKGAADLPAAARQSPGIMTPSNMIPPPPEEPAKKKKKKADKVRSAWISFTGRILAQVIGAAASVVFGLFLLQRYQSAGEESKPAPAAPAAASPAAVRTRRSPGETAIAVLPLANFSGDARQEYFVDGLTDALTTSLAQVKNMRVISRTSAMAYKRGQKSIPEIARELNVDLLVEGSVMRDRDRVRITAQLIDGATDEHLWARSFDRTTKDVLALQDDIARAIAAEVGAAAQPATPAPVDPAVYDLYLRGRFAWNMRTAAGFEQAERYFTEAIAKDAHFALGYAGLADVRANAVLTQLNAKRPRPAAALARWHAAAGNRDRAFEALGELVARSPAAVQPLKNDPLLDAMRADPRFEELIRRAAARLESKS